jgi:hypothetical protein
MESTSFSNYPSKEILQKLYKDGKSMTDIAAHLHCSIHKVVYWMEKYDIKRRSHSEATYLKENPNGDPFTINKKLTFEEKYLYGVAIGIYLGEGNKTINHSLRITNTNPLILKLFLQFLATVCHFDKNRISVSIVCFNDSDPEASRAYWSHQLKISPAKFGKITQIPPQGKGTYKRKSQYGVCTVQANNTKLTALLREQINKLEETLPG